MGDGQGRRLYGRVAWRFDGWFDGRKDGRSSLRFERMKWEPAQENGSSHPTSKERQKESETLTDDRNRVKAPR